MYKEGKLVQYGQKELKVLLDQFGVERTITAEPISMFDSDPDASLSALHISNRSVESKVSPFVKQDEARDEFERFKSFMFTAHADYIETDEDGKVTPLSFVPFVKRNFETFQMRFPQLLRLMQLALVLPLTSVP
eukprot:1583001-Pyramimonas_sp.AAC.1